MALTGINYFINKLGFNSSDFKIYYDFNQDSGVLIPSVTGGNSLYSGELSSDVNDFYSISGSGLFTGQYITVQNVDITEKPFSILMIYEKTGIYDSVLFSSYKTGSVSGYDVNLGYVIGINKANKVFFETYGADGPIIKTLPSIISAKNLVAVTYGNNVLDISIYDTYLEKFNSQTFPLDSSNLFVSDAWYIGKAVNAPSYFNVPAFSGYIDEFAYFNRALTISELNYLASGFYTSVVETMTPVTGVYTGRVTGYTTGQYPIGTGITGVLQIQTGTVTDNCGNVSPVYVYQNLTGTIYGSGVIPLYETGNYISGYITGVSFTDDTNFEKTFGMDGMVYLKKINPTEFTEFWADVDSTQIEKVHKEATYNFVLSQHGLRLDSLYQTGDINVYANGLIQIPSGYYYTGSLYNRVLNLDADYMITGYYIDFTGKFDGDDYVEYDVVSGDFEVYSGFSHDGTSETQIGGIVQNSLYFSGRRLISGDLSICDYYVTGSVFIFPSGKALLNGATGILLSAQNMDFTHVTGIFAVKGLGSKFFNDTSLVWLSGSRQKLDTAYTEISNVDLISGSGIFENKSGIFNNSQLFWEG